MKTLMISSSRRNSKPKPYAPSMAMQINLDRAVKAQPTKVKTLPGVGLYRPVSFGGPIREK